MNKVNKRNIKLSDFVFVTSNKNKIIEINEILGTNYKVTRFDVPEIQSLDLNKVIVEKAKKAYLQFKIPVAVEDVSIEIKSLNGLPGTFVKFFIKTLGIEGTVKLLGKKSKETKSTCAIAIYDGKTMKIFKGTVNGILIKKGRGKNGFGFDSAFIPLGYKQTYAEMSAAEKNKISHRAKALRKLKKYFTT